MPELSIKPMTIAEFLGWEAAQPEAPRFELINGAPHMMAPERIIHTDIKGAVYMALGRAIGRLNNPACRVFTEGVTVPVQNHSAYKPDVTVYCADSLDDNATVIEHPLIIVEILSPSTARFDRGAKLIGYFSLESVRHVLLIDPDARTIEHHQQQGVDITRQIIRQGMLFLDPPGLSVPVAELFEVRW